MSAGPVAGAEPLAANPETLMLEVAGTRLAVHRRGRGPAILCLHAIAHSGRDFARLAERLGDRFTIIAIDWPGHGESPPEAAPPTAERYAALLSAVADRLGLARFVIIGNSIGGAAAMLCTAAQADRVAALVLCNPGGLQRVGWLARLVCRRMAAFFAGGTRGERDYARRFRRYYEREVLPAAAAGWRRQEIVADADRTAPLLQAAWLGFAAPGADLRHLPQQFRCPVLYAWARNDRYVAWRRSRRAALTAPQHRVQLFAGGHAAFLEQPDEFETALLSFLDGMSLPNADDGTPAAARMRAAT